MPDVSTAEVRRSLDRSHRRKPLRVLITRRQARGHADGAEQYVTQVRFGGAEAVVVPWDNGGESREQAATA
jgi:hypothetical protein